MKIEKMFSTTTKKKQNKTTEKELNETEVRHLLDEEFKVTVIKMFILHSRKMNKLNENFNNLNKDIKISKKGPIRTEELIAEMKNALEGINSRSNDTRKHQQSGKQDSGNHSTKIKKKKELKK